MAQSRFMRVSRPDARQGAIAKSNIAAATGRLTG